MIRLRGEYEVTLDAKGRFLFPIGFKKQLPEQENSFVINRGLEKCLVLYPETTWQPLFEKIAQKNDFDFETRKFRRFFINGATDVEADTAGRILIPKNLKEYAGLEKDIVLVAAIEKIEIWDVATYKKMLVDDFSHEEFSRLAQKVMVENKNVNE